MIFAPTISMGILIFPYFHYELRLIVLTPKHLHTSEAAILQHKRSYSKLLKTQLSPHKRHWMALESEATHSQSQSVNQY